MSPAEAESVTSRAKDRAVWPWQAEPYRLWSLLDMIDRFPLRMFGSFLADFERTMAGLDMLIHPARSEANLRSFHIQAIQSFQRTLTGMVTACQDGNVPLTYAVEMQARDFMARAMDSEVRDIQPLLEHARLTRQAILHDLEGHLFLHVDNASHKFYTEPLAGWESVTRRFGCAFDIEEARKCFALGRYTAAIFHLMKTVEAAVIRLQAFLGDEPDVRAHFGSVVGKLERMLQKDDYVRVPEHLKGHLQFLREILTQLHAVKDSWRDKVSHADAHIVPTDTFTEELAKDVHDATLALMKKLATGLPETI